MKNIFNVYVEMESQEQCDRMKQLCVDNGLPIWCMFDKHKTDESIFFYEGDFWVTDVESNIKDIKLNNTQATETEFIELLKQYKDV